MSLPRSPAWAITAQVAFPLPWCSRGAVTPISSRARSSVERVRAALLGSSSTTSTRTRSTRCAEAAAGEPLDVGLGLDARPRCRCLRRAAPRRRPRSRPRRGSARRSRRSPAPPRARPALGVGLDPGAGADADRQPRRRRAGRRRRCRQPGSSVSLPSPSRGWTCRRGGAGAGAGACVADELVEQQGQGRVLSPPPGPVQTGLDEHSMTCYVPRQSHMDHRSGPVFCPQSGVDAGAGTTVHARWTKHPSRAGRCTSSASAAPA